MNNVYKKIQYRATHRGTRELDLMALKFLETFNWEDLKHVEELELKANEDDKLFEVWIVNKLVDNL